MKQILIIEDQVNLCIVLKHTFEQHHYKVAYTDNGLSGVKQFFSWKPHMVIVDLMLPKMDGYRVIKTIRETNQKTPILVLTAKCQSESLVKAFEYGCNDYIRKPFVMEELIARVKGFLREPDSSHQATGLNIKTFGKYRFSSTTMELETEGATFVLSHREAQILEKLVRHLNQTIERKAILLELWGNDNLFNSRTMNVYITRLRSYFENDPHISILNVRGIGYKLVVRDGHG